MITELHEDVAALLKTSAKRGWMAYEELNNAVPDEYVDPKMIDWLLVVLDSHKMKFKNLNDYKVWARGHGVHVPEVPRIERNYEQQQQHHDVQAVITCSI